MMPLTYLLMDSLGTASESTGQSCPRPEDLIHEYRQSQRFPLIFLDFLPAAPELPGKFCKCGGSAGVTHHLRQSR